MTVLLPLKGVSMIDAAGQPFDDPEAREALYAALKDKLDNQYVEVVEMQNHINDPEFAEYAAERLIELIEKRG